ALGGLSLMVEHAVERLLQAGYAYHLGHELWLWHERIWTAFHTDSAGTLLIASLCVIAALLFCAIRARNRSSLAIREEERLSQLRASMAGTSNTHRPSPSANELAIENKYLKR